MSRIPSQRITAPHRGQARHLQPRIKLSELFLTAGQRALEQRALEPGRPAQAENLLRTKLAVIQYQSPHREALNFLATLQPRKPLGNRKTASNKKQKLIESHKTIHKRSQSTKEYDASMHSLNKFASLPSPGTVAADELKMDHKDQPETVRRAVSMHRIIKRPLRKTSQGTEASPKNNSHTKSIKIVVLNKKPIAQILNINHLRRESCQRPVRTYKPILKQMKLSSSVLGGKIVNPIPEIHPLQNEGEHLILQLCQSQESQRPSPGHFQQQQIIDEHLHTVKTSRKNQRSSIRPPLIEWSKKRRIANQGKLSREEEQEFGAWNVAKQEDVWAENQARHEGRLIAKTADEMELLQIIEEFGL